MAKAIRVFVLLEHWGEYDYAGTNVAGIYKDINAANVRKARLEMAQVVEEIDNHYATPVFYEIEEMEAII